jgi:hypothetical protein
MAGGGCQPETRRQTSGCIEKTYYSTPATWKPFEKQKSVHMAYVMRLSAFDGPLRSRRPAALSRMQSPVVFQPLLASSTGATNEPAGLLSVVVKISSAFRRTGEAQSCSLAMTGCE